mgnify:FL=1
MSARSAHARFWTVTLAAVLAAAATALLGRWQMQRAAQKQALEEAVQAQGALPPLAAAALAAAAQAGAAPSETVLHRRVHLRGHWLAQHTVYLDNRQMQGRAGFFVLTPLQLEGLPLTLLVQRGWLARQVQDRTQLAPVDTPAGTVELSGRLAPAPARLLDLGGPAPGPGSSRIRQNLDLTAYAAETGLALAPWTVLQTEGPDDGLQRQWPAFTAGVEKHHGYAFQWFALSGLIALLYVWFQVVRRIRPRPGSAH